MKKKISDAWAYIQGKVRYKLYNSTVFSWLMRVHIYEQIEYRIAKMDPECYLKGACKICGCATTALQMANKACPKPCYPVMMNKKDWEEFKKVQNEKVEV